jgi:hypothetical protein
MADRMSGSASACVCDNRSQGLQRLCHHCTPPVMHSIAPMIQEQDSDSTGTQVRSGQDHIRRSVVMYRPTCTNLIIHAMYNPGLHSPMPCTTQDCTHPCHVQPRTALTHAMYNPGLHSPMPCTTQDCTHSPRHQRGPQVVIDPFHQSIRPPQSIIYTA